MTFKANYDNMEPTTKLIAFHGDPLIKAKYLSRVLVHREADDITHGFGYWDGYKGCAVGCTLHSGDHGSYETELGIPEALAHLEDDMFEAMPGAESRLWPEKFLTVIPVGADLSKVPQQYLAWMLRDLLTIQDLATDVASAVRGMADLMDRSLAGDEPSEAEWNEAERAARDARAARAARNAWNARNARDAWDPWAARAARNARAAWDPWAARNARDAWDAWDPWAARNAWAAWDPWDATARASHALRHSEKLLELLAAAPVSAVPA